MASDHKNFVYSINRLQGHQRKKPRVTRSEMVTRKITKRKVVKKIDQGMIEGVMTETEIDTTLPIGGTFNKTKPSKRGIASETGIWCVRGSRQRGCSR